MNVNVNPHTEKPRSDSRGVGVNALHTPVLEREALSYLNPQPGKRYVDATADGGGHAIAILEAIRPSGRILVLEWDEELVGALRDRLHRECSDSKNACVLRRANYTELAKIVRSSGFGPIAGVLFDLGASSFHLEGSRRGFSFRRNEDLDMRYSRDTRETAADMLRMRTAEGLEAMLRIYGGERFSRRIARAVVARRRERPIRTTLDLVAIIRHATPVPSHHGRIHFATRTFQALRIAVNHEFENIPRGLAAACEVLAPGGRIVVIAFHSGEDAIVKNFFKQPDIRSAFVPLTPKPIRPAAAEIEQNPRARSAILRAFEKTP